MPDILPRLNPEDQEWVQLVGPYILNMGAVEATTRLLIAMHETDDKAPVLSADLPSQIGFLRARFPPDPRARHLWAMNLFWVSSKRRFLES